MYVGKEEAVFFVERQHLRKIDLGVDYDDYTTYKLPDWRPKVFEAFHFWLKWDRLPPWGSKNLDPECDGMDKENFIIHIDLYGKAKEYEVYSLMEAITDNIRKRETCEYGYFPGFLINTIYDITDDDSGLRNYLVDSFVFKTSNFRVDEDGRMNMSMREEALGIIMKKFKAKHFKFLAECYMKIFDGKKMTDPNTTNKCTYHEHDEGQSCGSRKRKRKRDDDDE